MVDDVLGASQVHQSAKLIYLDPHLVRHKVCNLEEEYTDENDKFHCSEARLLDMTQLDPSISFGFLLQSYRDYVEFIGDIEAINKATPIEPILTVHSEGVEERILKKNLKKHVSLNDSVISGASKACHDAKYASSSRMLQSMVSFNSDYIKKL